MLCNVYNVYIRIFLELCSSDISPYFYRECQEKSREEIEKQIKPIITPFQII